MATSQTTNLQLTKYGAGTDNLLRSDYNGNLDKIDTFAGNTNQAIANINNALAGKVNTSDIANNLTTTSAGKVLDARQGKALSDSLGELIVRETGNASFTNGVATIAAKSGYKLMSVVTNRNDTSYSITTVTEQSDGTYLLYSPSNVTAYISIIKYWVKV